MILVSSFWGRIYIEYVMNGNWKNRVSLCPFEIQIYNCPVRFTVEEEYKDDAEEKMEMQSSTV